MHVCVCTHTSSPYHETARSDSTYSVMKWRRSIRQGRITLRYGVEPHIREKLTNGEQQHT